MRTIFHYFTRFLGKYPNVITEEYEKIIKNIAIILWI